jgi:hypothetical protein
MIESRKLPVKLTPDELEGIVHAHSDVCSKLIDIENRKRAALSNFRHERKPHVEERDRLELLKTTGVEERAVDCEIRESLVNGQMEAVRLDTMEVVDTWTPGADDEEADERQLALPTAAPPVPVQRCTAIDVDGVMYAVSPEQADVIDRLDVSQSKPERLIIDGTHRTIVAVKRGKACDTCGIVEPHHRPECAGMKADVFNDADGDVIGRVLLTDEDVDCDRNDTAAVAAHIAGMTQPSDAPLVPVGEDTKPLVKLPKRGKKAASEGEVSS